MTEQTVKWPVKDPLKLEDVIGLSLPKWPALKITGISVTKEQALDIISRTDRFLTSFSQYSGGNNHSFKQKYYERLGVMPLVKATDWARDVDQNDDTARQRALDKMHFAWEFRDKISTALHTVYTEYIGNDWAACSYIYGPHGWCHPDGQIAYEDNVGKWPSIEALYNELVELAKAFPYVTMTATVGDDEHCEDYGPVLTFVVHNGEVQLTKDHEAYHYDETALKTQREARSKDDAFAGLFDPCNSGREQGLPPEMIDAIIARFKPVIDPLMVEFEAEVAKLEAA